MFSFLIYSNVALKRFPGKIPRGKVSFGLINLYSEIKHYRKSGRAVEGTGLENQQQETVRGFESHLFRHPPKQP